MSRPSRDETFLEMAAVFAKRSTCSRRQVGCILTDQWGRVLSTGHNGVPTNEIHCTSVPCPGAALASGTGLNVCEAVHAEVNALLQCHDVMLIDTVYCTASPCVDCIKPLLNSSATRIVFTEEYPHPEAKLRWVKTGRLWIKLREGTTTQASPACNHPSIAKCPSAGVKAIVCLVCKAVNYMDNGGWRVPK